MTPKEVHEFLQQQGHTTTLELVEQQLVMIEGRVGSTLLLLTFFLTNPPGDENDDFLGFSFVTSLPAESEPNLEALNAMNRDETFFQSVRGKRCDYNCCGASGPIRPSN